MVRRFKKSGVQDIIKSLVDSEIPEIQAVAKQLSEWTKQLEEHSWKLQHYASEIESLAAAEAAEVRDEVSLAELVKDLEKTLSQLRGGPGKVAALPEGIKAATRDKIEEKPEEEEPMAVEKVSVGEGRITLQSLGSYTTPDGFVIRKTRR